MLFNESFKITIFCMFKVSTPGVITFCVTGYRRQVIGDRLWEISPTKLYLHLMFVYMF